MISAVPSCSWLVMNGSTCSFVKMTQRATTSGRADPLPHSLTLSPVSCAQIVQQRLASTSLDITQFADLFVVPCQPKALLDRCAARYDVLYRATDEPATIFSLCPTAQQATLTLESF